MIDFSILDIETPRILEKAKRYLSEEPRTVTADTCDRSEGGLHDYYSEGDYWWPNPEDPDGPYIRRDGETNPGLFYHHRHNLVRLSEIVGTMTSAYRLTGDESYATHAVEHIRAWFVDDETRMNPHLLYGQAIKGHVSGRGVGIIDTIHLCEVVASIQWLKGAPSLDDDTMECITDWFRAYLAWINSHEYGIKEKHAGNNHGVCWSMQAATFARLVGNDEILAWVRQQFKTVYMGEQMALDGGLPAELKRTKPYGYSLFTIDALAGVALFASTPEDDLWSFELPDGRSMRRGLEFIYPYIEDKSSWPKEPDVMYWDEWPVRHPSLLLAGLKYGNDEYLRAWKGLKPDSDTFEIKRNWPLRHPLIWLGDYVCD